jgi:hypothetical protein
MPLTPDQLRQFCADANEGREWMRRPFKRDEFVYATNGAMIVRVAAAGLSASDFPAGKLELLDQIFSPVAPERFIKFPKPDGSKRRLNLNGRLPWQQ